MIDHIRAAGTVSCRHFATARELEGLLTDGLAVLLSETFAGVTISTGVRRPSPAGPGEPAVAELPTGTVTFLLAALEGSARLWEADPDAMKVALKRHDRLLAEVIEDHGGKVIILPRGG